VDQCKPLNLGAYRRYMAHPALLAQVMWPLAVLGRTVQVDSMKPKLKPPGTERLKLTYDKLLSILLQCCFQIQLAALQVGPDQLERLPALMQVSCYGEVGRCTLTLSTPL